MESSAVRYQKQYVIYADYHQFYLKDAGNNPFAPEDHTEQDIHRRIKAADNVVVIQPERSMTVPVELEILDFHPPDDFERWHHVAEASLELPSGKLRIEEWGNAEAVDEIVLGARSYRIRAYYGGLDTLSFDGLDGDDHYKIVIWPSPVSDVTVVKQYPHGRGKYKAKLWQT